MAGVHSRFAPSSAHRRVECPASLLLEEQEPDTPTFEAVEGTVAHYIHEQALLGVAKLDSFIGMHPAQFMPENELTADEWKLIPYSRGLKPDEDFIVDRDMINHVEESVLRCLETPGDRYVEQRVDISPWCPPVDEHGKPMPKQGGTADFFACSPGLLDITDLKYGAGVQVFATRNYQAIKYALGVINEYDWMYDFDKIVIRINQPRFDHYDVWETTKAELLEIGEYIKSRYLIALQPNAPFGASEKACQFCKIKYKCAHLTNVVLSHFDFEEDATVEDVKTQAAFLSLERQVEIFKMRGLFKMWIGAIEGDIEAQLKRDPSSVPGLRLVNGRSFRQWANEQQAQDELLFAGLAEDKIYTPRKLISPAQAEKLGRKAIKPLIASLVVKPLGEPVVVDEFDPRPDFVSDNSRLVAKHFDVEDED